MIVSLPKWRSKPDGNIEIPMRRKRAATRNVELETLRDCWGRWTGVVELFARRRAARRHIESRGYRELYQELIAACDALVIVSEGETRAFYQRIKDLVRPWLSLPVLARADREILYDLMHRFEDIDHRIGKRRRWREKMWAIPDSLLIGGLIASLVYVTFVFVENAWTMPWWRWVRSTDWFAFARNLVIQAGDLEKLFVIAVILIGVSIYVVSRSARS